MHTRMGTQTCAHTPCHSRHRKTCNSELRCITPLSVRSCQVIRQAVDKYIPLIPNSGCPTTSILSTCVLLHDASLLNTYYLSLRLTDPLELCLLVATYANMSYANTCIWDCNRSCRIKVSDDGLKWISILL